MSKRRTTRAVFGNPALVGAVTVLVVVVAVFLAYNANAGLPFVPTTELRLRLSNGANLGVGGEVRAGGTRIGAVRALRPVRRSGGGVGAEATLELDRKLGDLPRDTTFTIRMRSAVGLKYVEVEPGRSRETFADGAVVPATRTHIPVDLDEALSALDRPTRAGARRVLRGAGDGLAGRGGDLHRAIRGAPELLDRLAPVMASLADRRARLPRAITEAADLVRVLRPVARRQARTFATMSDTFTALTRDPSALEETLARAPRTLAAAERSLPRIRPFLVRAAALAPDLTAAARGLGATLPTVLPAIETATPALGRTPPLSEDLGTTFAALGRVARDPSTGTGLRALTGLVDTLQPTVRFVGPHITVCNLANMFFTFVPEVISAPTRDGQAQRGIAQYAAPQEDGVFLLGANEFAVGRGAPPGTTPQHLHKDIHAAAVDDRGNADCELGQKGYLHSVNPHDTTPDKRYRRAVVTTREDLAGGSPNFRVFDGEGRGSGRGPNRVPEGQTFTRDPGGRAAPEDE